MAQYNQIVSIGGNCAPAMAIRNYFGITHAFPFDWWICDLERTTALIKNNFDKMFEDDEMRIISDYGSTVISTRYNICYHHDFERDPAGNVISEISRQLPALREKYAFLISRMDRLLSFSRVIFVRDSGAGPYEYDISRVHSQASELIAALRGRWPHADISLLFLSDVILPDIQSLPKIPGIAWDRLGEYQGNMWRTEQFQSLFQRHEISLL